MAEFRTNPDGTVERRSPGEGWRPSSPEDQQAFEMSTPEAIGTGFAGAVKESAAFLENFTPAGINRNIMERITGGEMGTSALEGVARADDALQDANMANNPTADFIGQAAEMLIPGVGAGKAAKVGKATIRTPKPRGNLATDAIGATPSAGERNILQRGYDTAAEAFSNVAQRAKTGGRNKPSTMGDVRVIDAESMKIQRGVAEKTGRVAGLSADPQKRFKDTFGPVSDDMPISTAEQAQMHAWDGPSLDAGNAARERAQRAKMTAFDPGGTVQRQVEDQRDAWGAARILDELGLSPTAQAPGFTRLTSEAIGTGYKRAGEVFTRLIDDVATNGRPIEATMDQIRKIADDLDGVADVQKSKKLTSLHDEMKKVFGNGQTVDGKQFQAVYNRVKKARDSWHRSGNADPVQAQAADDLMESLQRILGNRLNDAEKTQLLNARKHWGILSDLTRGKAVDTNSGSVNWTTFGNNRARHNADFKTNRSATDDWNRSGDEFGRNMAVFDADVRALKALDQPMIEKTGINLGPMLKAGAAIGAGALGVAAFN